MSTVQQRTVARHWRSRQGLIVLNPDAAAIPVLGTLVGTYPLSEFHTEEKGTAVDPREALSRLLTFIERTEPFTKGDYLVLHHNNSSAELMLAVPNGYFTGKALKVPIPGRTDLFLAVIKTTPCDDQ